MTPLLCCTRGLSTCTPSLANLVSQMLGRHLRQEGAPHDCEQDAAAAMQLVNHALRHGIPAPMDAPEIKVCVEVGLYEEHSFQSGMLMQTPWLPNTGSGLFA